MEPTTVIALGLVAAVIVILLAIRWGPSRRGDRAPAPDDASTRTAESPGPTRIRPSRIVVVGDPRPSTGIRTADPLGRIGATVRPRRRLLRDTSAVVLVASLVIVIVINLPAFGGQSGQVLSATATPAVAVASPVEPSIKPSGGSGSGASPEATSTAGAQPSASTASSAPTGAGPLPSSTPSSASLALLTPCEGRPDCYVYVVQRGDNLSELSRLFGVPIDAIVRLNRQITDPSIILVGDRLILPTPTR